ncbi:mitogen-activated protein kinase-binding protein 1-like protein, partial [Lates japonicus]
ALQTTGEDRSTFILYPNPNTTSDREFDVEAVTDPRRSLTQLEVRGQGVEPVWSTQLSPDSACSEGSAGSLEQQHDTDTDSLSQGSSVGSLGLEDDDDRNSLKNHFDTLASSLSEEKFDTDLRNLQPPEEKHFLNPRLSISTRFLSRFQDRIRAWPSRAPPLVSIPTRISEESIVSNTVVNLESSVDVGSAESTQRENSSVVGDVTSRTLAAHNSSLTSGVQQGAPRLGYLGTTASSRAKVSQDPPTSSTISTQEEEKENLSSSDPQPPASLLSAGLDPHSPKPDPHQDQTTSVAVSSQESQHPVPQVLATPTEVTSQGGVERWSVSSSEATPTNQNQTLILSPAPSITPTATPTTCDITISDIITSAIASEITTASGQGGGVKGTETRIQTDRVSTDDVSKQPVGADSSSSDPPTSSSSPLSERLGLPQTGSGDVEESFSLQQCQQVANELRQTARRAVRLYQQLGVSPGVAERRLQMSSVLQEAFDFVYSEMQVVLQKDGQSGGAPSGPLEDDGTMSLLEKYSEMLVQMTQNKLNRI